MVPMWKAEQKYLMHKDDMSEFEQTVNYVRKTFIFADYVV